MSFPDQNTVAQINRATGALVATYGDRAGSYTFSPTTWSFEFQHFPNITAAGTLIVSSHLPAFPRRERGRRQPARVHGVHHRSHRTSGWSRSGSTARAPEWADVTRAWRSACANGNTLANYGTGGVIREITPDKQIVFQVKFDSPDRQRLLQQDGRPQRAHQRPLRAERRRSESEDVRRCRCGAGALGVAGLLLGGGVRAGRRWRTAAPARPVDDRAPRRRGTTGSGGTAGDGGDRRAPAAAAIGRRAAAARRPERAARRRGPAARRRHRGRGGAAAKADAATARARRRGRGGRGGTGATAASGGAAASGRRGGTAGAGAGDAYVTGVTVTVSPMVNTILVVNWTQAKAAEQVWLEFSLRGLDRDDLARGGRRDRRAPRRRPRRARLDGGHGPHRQPAGRRRLQDPRLHGDDRRGAVRHAAADDDVLRRRRWPARIATWILGSRRGPPAAAPTGSCYFVGPYWVYIMDRQGRIVWYYTDTTSNASTQCPAHRARRRVHLDRQGPHRHALGPEDDAGSHDVLADGVGPGLSDAIDVTTDGCADLRHQRRAARDEQGGHDAHDLELPGRARRRQQLLLEHRSTGTPPTTRS